METLNEKLEDVFIVSNILLKYGKDNPDIVEYLSKNKLLKYVKKNKNVVKYMSKNKLVTKDKNNNLCVVISYKKLED